MAAAATTAAQHPTPATFAGRSTSSNYIDYAAFPSYYTPTPATSSPGKKNKLRLITSSSSSKIPKAGGLSSDAYSAGPSPASSTSNFPPPRSDSRPGGKMSSSLSGDGGYRIPATHSAAALREGPGRAKLHKRGSSGSSLKQQQQLGSSLPASTTLPQQTWSASPYAHDEAYTPTSSTPTPTGSMPKIRPYLRKVSTKEDAEQGRLDLSKSISENHALSGLGIQDLSLLGSTGAPRSASDVSFSHTKRGGHAHTRTTSGDSTVSTSSARPGAANKTFVHPMRQTPRPYTPPQGHSFDFSSPPAFASSQQQDAVMNDEERNESSDVLTDDDTAFRLSGFRGRRSVSISSTPVVVAPTPLSQSHTASDLGIVPKLTDITPTSGTHAQHANTSQTNLSLKSTRSGKSSSAKSKPTRSRRNTERSFDTPTTTTASARTSFDKAFSFGGGGRKSDSDPRTRDQRIEDARRKFEEKEERKERKAEGRLMKRRATEEARTEKVRRKSEGRERERERKKSLPSSFPSAAVVGEEWRMNGGEHARPPPLPAPVAVEREAGATRFEEKRPPATATRKVDDRTTKPPNKFSVWLKMTLLSCGGKG